MANQSILAAFERMWQHIVAAISGKADKSEIPTKTSDLLNDSGFKTTDNYHTTGSWEGLTYTANAVGGAGELKFTLPVGTGGDNVAVGDHNHSISEITNLGDTLNGKANTTHTHTSNEVVMSSGLAELVDCPDGEPVDFALEEIITRINNKPSASDVDNKISAHNTSGSVHNDIRLLVTEIQTKLTNFLNVDDSTVDQLSEVIELINNNKGTLESLTTSKINVTDIVNNLETNVSSKVLSASQGVYLKGLIDDLQQYLDDQLEDVAYINLAGNENITDAENAETWTFTLENGSTVTKRVVLA